MGSECAVHEQRRGHDCLHGCQRTLQGFPLPHPVVVAVVEMSSEEAEWLNVVVESELSSELGPEDDNPGPELSKIGPEKVGNEPEIDSELTELVNVIETERSELRECELNRSIESDWAQ